MLSTTITCIQRVRQVLGMPADYTTLQKPPTLKHSRPQAQSSPSQVQQRYSKQQQSLNVWLVASIAFAAIFSLMGMQEAFSAPGVIPDDARQHLFWLQKFSDPELFQNDYIADYYQSIAPAGYTLLYRVAAAVGLHPLLFNKILPVALAILTAAFSFWTSLALFPIPSAAFLSSLLLSQSLAVSDMVFSGTPKAFVFVAFLGFSCMWMRRSLWGTILTLILESWFYPPTVLVSAGVMALALVDWKKLRWQSDRRTIVIGLVGVAVAVGVLLPYVIGTNEYGPTISAADAKLMPEFYSGGRTSFFSDDWYDYWFNGRSGLRLSSVFTPLTHLFGLGLLGMVWFPQQFPLVKVLTERSGFIVRLFCTAMGLYFAAHLLLFTLYLPSRFSSHYLRIVFALAGGITICILLDALLHHALVLIDRQSSRQSTKAIMATTGRAIASLFLALSIAMITVGYPATISGFPVTYYAQANQFGLYEFLETQPKSSQIATLSNESSNIPALARRSVFVGKEFALPYQVGYYREISRRIRETMAAQYSSSPEVVRKFIEQNNVNLWLLDRQSFAADTIATNSWLAQFQPTHQQVLASFQREEQPLIQQLASSCAVFSNNAHLVLSSDCILQELDAIATE
ncbi:MAG: hypothetical protein AAF974_00285 [Cyanobacteria bacterium P01_E01_bin.34]